MAHELLTEPNITHLYRHDVESLFYIILLLGARHEFVQVKDRANGETRQRIVMRKDELPYAEWFDQPNYASLGKDKSHFFSNAMAIQLSPSFELLRPWLRVLRFKFSDGFLLKSGHKNRKEFFGDGVGPFDDETLEDRISYSSLIEPVRLLEKELK